jgi:WD40 repeat protein
MAVFSSDRLDLRMHLRSCPFSVDIGGEGGRVGRMRGLSKAERKNAPSPCRLPQIVCDNLASSSESARPQTIRGRGDKSLLCNKRCATSKQALQVCLPAIFKLLAVLLVICGTTQIIAQAPNELPEELPVILRYDGGGINHVVKGLQWSSDSRTLYAAGWGKVVQVFHRSEQNGQLEYAPRENFRVPLGDGRSGMIETLAVSANGRMLAAAGSAWDGVPPADRRYLWPRAQSTSVDWEKIGVIHVFDTASRRCQVLKGHAGNVRQIYLVENPLPQVPKRDTDDIVSFPDPSHLVAIGLEYEGQQIRNAVRVWDLKTGMIVGQPLKLPRVIIPPESDLTPRIAAWKTANGTLQVAIAAWKPGGTPVQSDAMIWTPGRSDPPQRITGMPVSLALGLSGPNQPRQLFCGGIGTTRLVPIESAGSGGQARNTALSAQSMSAAALSPAGMPPQAFPVAAAALPSGSPNENPQFAVVHVTLQNDGRKQFGLSFCSSAGFRNVGPLWVNVPGAGQAEAPLTEPVVTVSPDGRTIAVAGMLSPEVRLYSVAELQQRPPSSGAVLPTKVLAPRNVFPVSAEFVSRDDEPGILVRTRVTGPRKSGERPVAAGGVREDPQLQTWVLNANTGTLTQLSPDEIARWKPSRPETGSRSLSIRSDRRGVDVRDAAGQQHSLRLPEDFRAEGTQEFVTAVALTRQAGSQLEIAVVATHVQGEPSLNLYDAVTGNCLRRLNGHDARISALAFSADGRMLLSTAEDGTVRCWILKDLVTAVAGRIGRLDGILLQESDGTIRVSDVRSGSPAASRGLQVGDILETLAGVGKAEPITSVRDFYLKVSQTPPIDVPEVKLRIRRGATPVDLSISNEQGIDQVDPLFSLLLSSADDAEPGSWLVWSPTGQFEYQGDSLERQLGWHINSGDDTAPVSFASVDQYRDRFLRRGLLKELLAGNSAMIAPPPAPEIRLSLESPDGESIFVDEHNELLVRHPDTRLILEVDGVDPENLLEPDWSFDDYSETRFERDQNGLWTSSFVDETLRPGTNSLRIRVLTTDAPSLEHHKSFVVRFEPKPPELKLTSPQQRFVTTLENQLALDVQITASTATTVNVVVESDNAGDWTSEERLSGSGRFQRQLPLQEGTNRIRVTAKPAISTAVPQEEDAALVPEAILDLVAEYRPPGPPRIALVTVTESAGSAPSELVAGVLQVQSAAIVVSGVIESEVPLEVAELQVADQSETLESFEPGKAPRFEFSQSVQLKPGRQILQLKAAGGGKSSTVPLPLEFVPPLPVIQIVRPERPDITVRLGTEPLQIPFAAALQKPSEYPFDAVVLVNGNEDEQTPLTIDQSAGQLTGTVSIVPDGNREYDDHHLELRLSNEWGRTEKTALHLNCLHPPVIESLNVERDGDSVSARLVCSIRTSMLRPVNAIELKVNETAIKAPTFTPGPIEQDRQRLTITGVGLNRGSNLIVVALRNRDGISEEMSVEHTVPDPPKRSRIRILSPLASRVSSQQSLPIAFDVHSDSPLNSVDLVVERDKQQPERISLLAKSERPAAGEADLIAWQRFQHTLSLASGANRIRVEVHNAGGLEFREFVMSWVPPPVSITLKRLDTASSQNPIQSIDEERVRFESLRGAVPVSVRSPIHDEHVPNGTLVSSVSDGHPTLVGEIAWLQGHRPPGASWTIRVWVNGFLMSRRIAAPKDEAGILEFRVPVTLNQSLNRIRVEAPGMASGDRPMALEDHVAAVLSNVTVLCSQPELRQRLHLVLMGIRMEEGRNACTADELTDGAAEALQLKTPISAFSEVRSYKPLVGEQAVGRNLRTMMALIESRMAKERLEQEPSDVVMMYYVGVEHRRKDGDFLLEDYENHENPVAFPQSISESDLARMFASVNGAHVVFLDVANTERSDPGSVPWPRYPNLGVFRASRPGQEVAPAGPGLLLTSIRSVVETPAPASPISLDRLADQLRSDFQSAAGAGRLAVEILLPEDLRQLVVSRSGTGNP